MAETGKKQTKRKERGLNVRVTQAQKTVAHDKVRVNSYQKKSKKHPSNDEITKKIEETTKNTKKKSKKAEKTVKNVEKVEKKVEKKAEKDEKVEKVEEVAKKAEKVEETAEIVEKNEEKIENVKKPATFSKGVVEKAKTDEKVEKKAEIKPEAEVKKEVKSESDAKKPELDAKKPEPNFAEFETMKIREIEKPESKIVLRDVEKTKTLGGTKFDSSKVGNTDTEAKVKKEELPPVIKTASRTEPAPKLSAREIKEHEIEKAVKAVSKLPSSNARKTRKKMAFSDFGWPRVVLAVACAATAVFAIAYFVNLTSTDMSLKVAAMQSGIEATYPSYIPRDYTLSDVTSASGKVIIHFKNGDDEFGITEETTNWDSEALLNEYIKENYGNDYTVVREQGLTLYMGRNWEAWVNGGVLYKLSVTHGSLTKKQMKSIAVSL